MSRVTGLGWVVHMACYSGVQRGCRGFVVGYLGDAGRVRGGYLG